MYRLSGNRNPLGHCAYLFCKEELCSITLLEHLFKALRHGPALLPRRRTGCMQSARID